MTEKNNDYSKPLSAFILDIDNVLINEEISNGVFEMNLKMFTDNYLGINTDYKNKEEIREHRKQFKEFIQENNCIYQLYDGISELLSLSIPFVIISKSSKERLRVIFQLKNVISVLYKDTYYCELNKPVGQHKINYEKYSTKKEYLSPFIDKDRKVWKTLYDLRNNMFLVKKDSSLSNTIYDAKQYLKNEFNLTDYDRIIGIGVSEEFSNALNDNNIESCKALWNKSKLLNKYNYDYTCKHPKTLYEHIKNNIDKNSFFVNNSKSDFKLNYEEINKKTGKIRKDFKLNDNKKIEESREAHELNKVEEIKSENVKVKKQSIDKDLNGLLIKAKLAIEKELKI